MTTEDNALNTQELTIVCLDSHGKPISRQWHIVWSLERFLDRLNKEAAANRKKGEGFTAWSLV